MLHVFSFANRPSGFLDDTHCAVGPCLVRALTDDVPLALRDRRYPAALVARAEADQALPPRGQIGP